VDAILLLACDDLETLNKELKQALREISRIGHLLGVERGITIRSEDGDALEHFGFRDGMSQPQFFDYSAGDPDRATPDIVLEEDRLAGEPDAYGSYLVYRKLEQNVKAFRVAEESLADTLQLEGSARERAGAMMVGRYRDGSPVTTHQCPANMPGNTFDYEQDTSGAKCPLHAHIRKVRPRRGEQPRMVRRGVPYGDYHPLSSKEFPEKDCGLLFLSFQKNIFRQFGFVQRAWANMVDFPETLTGQDPLIAQNFRGVPQRWPKVWDKPAVENISLGGYVTLKGGEFLFAPSLSFFARLGEQ
jgi:Dyp-type peroxidase family